MYQKSDTISGGTAGAITHTRQTGQLVGGSDHIQKGFDSLRGLQNILSSGTQISSGDLQKISYMLGELQKALSGLVAKKK